MGLGGEGTMHRYPSIYSVRNMVEHLAYLLINIRNEVQSASNQRLADADLQSTHPSLIDIFQILHLLNSLLHGDTFWCCNLFYRTYPRPLCYVPVQGNECITLWLNRSQLKKHSTITYNTSYWIATHHLCRTGD